MLLSIVPLPSHKPKTRSECWKAVHDTRGHLFFTEVVV